MKCKWPASKVREIVRLYHEGLGAKRIGRRTGVPFETVRDILEGGPVPKTRDEWSVLADYHADSGDIHFENFSRRRASKAPRQVRASDLLQPSSVGRGQR